MNYVYIRYSTDRQDERQQMVDIESYIRTKGLTVDRVESDEGISGGISYKERKLFLLVQRMQAGDSLIVSEISRLGRSMSDLNRLVNDELKPRGVRLIVIKMGIDLDCGHIKAIDEMILQSFAFAAQMEKELIQDRTRNALESRKRAGQAIGGTNELWGRRTRRNRARAIARASNISAEARRSRAMSNANNRDFHDFMEDWQAIHGKVGWQTDWKAVADKLNSRDMKTATGLNYTPERARSMYIKITKLWQ